LPKYKQSLRDRGNEKKVSHYVGADFSSSSLQSAKQRLVELNVEFPAIFIVADMTEETQEIDKVL
jgi:ubiquinone/menaquinone biosynthesis C-methylase UbiE